MTLDNEIFQPAVLGLLALGVLIELLVLSSLSRIKKDLRDRSTSMGTASPAMSAQPAVSAPQPAAVQPLTATPVATTPAPQANVVQPVAQTASAAAAEPQDQPFERDGRWWFRRGNELLVYDEQAGQWAPAPAGAGAGAAGAPAAATAVAPAAEDAGFWKCPSCGAVNGSTATSCRMCFSPKP